MFLSCLLLLSLNWVTGDRCDEDGYTLPSQSGPPASFEDPDSLFPFAGIEEMLLADFIYKKIQISAGDISYLMTLWDSYQNRVVTNQFDHPDHIDPPFANSQSLYDTIDSIPFGDIPWEGFKVKYDGEIPNNAPSWMTSEYDVWYRNPLDVMEAQLGNPEFASCIDYAPKEVKNAGNGQRQYIDLMSGEWAWEQAVIVPQASFYVIHF
jgi:hypothetical protein